MTSKLTSKEYQAVGFIPGYVKFSTKECQFLNQELASFLHNSGLEPFSWDWFQKAKEFHKKAKQVLVANKYRIVGGKWQ